MYEDTEKAIKCGMNECLLKPVQLMKLKDILQKEEHKKSNVNTGIT